MVLHPRPRAMDLRMINSELESDLFIRIGGVICMGH
jgi:hypothetical protein